MTTTQRLPKPGTHNAILLSILSDGKPHTTTGIIRAHPMMVHSRVSDLRKPPYNYEIVHETVKGRRGGRAHQYTLLNPPAGAVVSANGDEPVVEWEEIWPRTAEYRYRLYRLDDEGEPVVLTAVPTPEELGFALVHMGGEGQLDRTCIGILDVMAEPGAKKWILNPWDQR